MSRLTLPILAALATSMALSTPAASAQVELASLDAPASSSSSLGMFANSTQPAPAQTAPAMKLKSSEGGGPFSGIGVAVKVGLAGVGFDVATPLVPGRLNLRGGASFFSYSPSTITTSDNLNINGSLKFQNAAATVDYFPFRGRFRLSGGMTVYNFTNLNAAVTVPAGNSFTLGNTTYYSDPNAPLTGNATFNFGGKTAGRVSIGTGNLLSKKGRFTFQSELGVQFFSSPTVVYAFTGNGCQTKVGNVYTNCGPVATTDVTNEQNKMQNDLTDLKYFPVLSVGLGFRIH